MNLADSGVVLWRGCVGRAFLMSFRGMGLKSVECIRLLTLHHPSFPVSFTLRQAVWLWHEVLKMS
jgi:hypothetical protein